MPTERAATQSAEQIRQELADYIEEAVRQNGGRTDPVDPGHRVPFHWPPHPISYKYHVLPSDWTGRAVMRGSGETFEVKVARTPHGVFGRCDSLWHEARGDSLDEMLHALEREAQPLFARQLAIARSLGKEGRFTGHIRDLGPADLLKLLYCSDRDVANEARIEIETHASSKLFLPSLILILKDRRHPNRRSAQWCALDLLEDLPSFSDSERSEEEAIEAIKSLIWDAPDDYARTIYKAGVVLGGHMPDEHGGAALLECLAAPSKVGRRSAIHGLFHVAEWRPELRDEIVSALRSAASKEPEPLLVAFALGMARDIESANYDHVLEPVFPEEESPAK